jgi:hypothetical protein
MDSAGATAAIAAAMNDTAVGLDINLKDFTVLSARERRERQATTRAGLLAGRQIENLFNNGQGGVIAALRTRLAGLLAARLFGLRHVSLGGIMVGGGAGAAAGLGRFAFVAVELLFEVTNARLQLLVFLFENAFTCHGLFVQGLPVSGTAEWLEAFSQMRTNGTRTVLWL